MYQEAAPILYGLNTFSFAGQYGWHNLFYFGLRLTDISRNNIRRLDLNYPNLERVAFGTPKMDVDFDYSVKAGLKIIKILPHLKTLCFRVCDDIMARDLNVQISFVNVRGKVRSCLRWRLHPITLPAMVVYAQSESAPLSLRRSVNGGGPSQAISRSLRVVTSSVTKTSGEHGWSLIGRKEYWRV